MARYRVTFGFRSGPYSPSETYISKDVSVGNLGPLVQSLLNDRLACLPSTIEVVGVRVGIAEGGRRSNLYIPGGYSLAKSGIELDVPAKGTFTILATNEYPDQGRACLQVKVRFDDDRYTTRYFSFVPDAVLRGGPDFYYPGGNPAWADKFSAFATRVVADSWSIRGRSKTGDFTPVDILKWVQFGGEGSIIGVVVSTENGARFAQRQVIQILNSRRKGTDKVTYNGKYYVDSVSTTTVPGSIVVWLAGSEGGLASSIKLPGKIQRVATQYYTIQAYIPWKAGIHKRGNSFGSLRGRRLNRVSLDF